MVVLVLKRAGLGRWVFKRLRGLFLLGHKLLSRMEVCPHFPRAEGPTLPEPLAVVEAAKPKEVEF